MNAVDIIGIDSFSIIVGNGFVLISMNYFKSGMINDYISFYMLCSIFSGKRMVDYA
jgi:hypothetical protein